MHHRRQGRSQPPTPPPFPDELYINAGKYHGAANYNMVVRHLHDIGGGSVLTAPSIADLENPARPYRQPA